jgi:hypothetical protein
MGSLAPIIGGSVESSTEDTEGPEIRPILNGQSNAPFLFQTPTLSIGALLLDQSGIDVSGLVPSQNLSIQLNDQDPIIVNEKYLAKNGTYQEGEFSITLGGFKEGQNSVTIRAWDNVGNGSSLTFEVEIEGSSTLKILQHKVYPNPASTESNFEIRHNRPGENLNLTLAVYSLSGQILFSETFRLVSAEEIIDNLSWIFFQSQSKYPAKGTYIYKLDLYSESDLTSDSVSGKIVIQ